MLHEKHVKESYEDLVDLRGLELLMVVVKLLFYHFLVRIDLIETSLD